MTFQAYLQTIKEKTGKTPEDFKRIMEEKGVITKPLTATEFCDFLFENYGLGHGHNMALWKLFKENNWVQIIKK